MLLWSRWRPANQLHAGLASHPEQPGFIDGLRVTEGNSRNYRDGSFRAIHKQLVASINTRFGGRAMGIIGEGR